MVSRCCSQTDSVKLGLVTSCFLSSHSPEITGTSVDEKLYRFSNDKLCDYLKLILQPYNGCGGVLTSVNMTPVQNVGHMNDIAVNETLVASSCMYLLLRQTWSILKLLLQRTILYCIKQLKNI